MSGGYEEDDPMNYEEYLEGSNGDGGFSRVDYNSSDRPEKLHVFRGSVVHASAKARLILVEETDEELWFPNSQTRKIGEPDEDGVREFTVTNWIASRNGMV